MATDSNAKALQFIEEMTRNVDRVQEHVLAQILSQNSETEYLKGFHLAGATDRETFKSKIPMVTYENIQPLIQRIANGDRSPILSARPISEFLTRYYNILNIKSFSNLYILLFYLLLNHLYCLQQFRNFSWWKKADANYQWRMGSAPDSIQSSYACYGPVSCFFFFLKKNFVGVLKMILYGADTWKGWTKAKGSTSTSLNPRQRRRAGY